MEDIQGANGQEGIQPEVSPPQNEVPVGMESQSSAETLNTEGQVPYHERLNNDPGFKSYIDRMKEKEVQERVDREVAYQLALKQQQQSQVQAVDPLKESIDQLNKKLLEGKGDANDLAELTSKVVEVKLKTERESERRKQESVSNKLSSFYSRHPDWKQYDQKMSELVSSYSEEEKEMIKGSDRMLDSIYDQARLSVQASKATVNPYSNPARGASSSGRSQNPMQKMGLTDDKSVASDALIRGDKATYEKIMKGYSS